MDMKHIVEFIGDLGDLLGVLIIAISAAPPTAPHRVGSVSLGSFIKGL